MRPADAVREAKSIAGEALRLSKLTGDPVLIVEATRGVRVKPENQITTR